MAAADYKIEEGNAIVTSGGYKISIDKGGSVKFLDVPVLKHVYLTQDPITKKFVVEIESSRVTSDEFEAFESELSTVTEAVTSVEETLSLDTFKEEFPIVIDSKKQDSKSGFRFPKWVKA